MKMSFQTNIVIVEHNLKSLLHVAHRGYILVKGQIAMEGPISELSNSETLEKVFFGNFSQLRDKRNFCGLEY